MTKAIAGAPKSVFSIRLLPLFWRGESSPFFGFVGEGDRRRKVDRIALAG